MGSETQLKDLIDKLNLLEKSLAKYEIASENQKENISGVKELAEETSQIVAEGLTEFRQIVDNHSKTLDQLDIFIRSGNGNQSLLVRTALLEDKLQAVKEELKYAKGEASRHRGESAEMLARVIEDQKDKRSSNVAILVAVISLLGTIATAILTYFKS